MGAGAVVLALRYNKHTTPKSNWSWAGQSRKEGLRLTVNVNSLKQDRRRLAGVALDSAEAAGVWYTHQQLASLDCDNFSPTFFSQNCAV